MGDNNRPNYFHNANGIHPNRNRCRSSEKSGWCDGEVDYGFVRGRNGLLDVRLRFDVWTWRVFESLLWVWRLFREHALWWSIGKTSLLTVLLRSCIRDHCNLDLFRNMCWKIQVQRLLAVRVLIDNNIRSWSWLGVGWTWVVEKSGRSWLIRRWTCSYHWWNCR